MTQTSTARRDRAAVAAARDYLLGFEGITERILEEHLSPSPARTVPGVYCRLLESAQNFQMAPKVIGGAIGGVDKPERFYAWFKKQQPTLVRENNWSTRKAEEY